MYDSKSRRKEVMDAILDFLESDNVDDALDYIWGLRRRFRKRCKRKYLQKLAEYIQRNIEGTYSMKKPERREYPYLQIRLETSSPAVV